MPFQNHETQAAYPSVLMFLHVHFPLIHVHVVPILTNINFYALHWCIQYWCVYTSQDLVFTHNLVQPHIVLHGE